MEQKDFTADTQKNIYRIVCKNRCKKFRHHGNRINYRGGIKPYRQHNSQQFTYVTQEYAKCGKKTGKSADKKQIHGERQKQIQPKNMRISVCSKIYQKNDDSNAVDNKKTESHRRGSSSTRKTTFVIRFAFSRRIRSGTGGCRKKYSRTEIRRRINKKKTFCSGFLNIDADT
ncbi:MAG: hypothetical protein R2941_13195 [Desulfobacterales bacterium]